MKRKQEFVCFNPIHAELMTFLQIMMIICTRSECLYVCDDRVKENVCICEKERGTEHAYEENPALRYQNIGKYDDIVGAAISS